MTPSSDAPVPAGVATLFDQGRVANTAGRPTEAERLLRRALDALDGTAGAPSAPDESPFPSLGPDAACAQEAWVRVMLSLSTATVERQGPTAAMEMVGSALEVAEQVPAAQVSAALVALCRSQLGVLHARAGRPREALAELDVAAEAMDSLGPREQFPILLTRGYLRLDVPDADGAAADFAAAAELAAANGLVRQEFMARHNQGLAAFHSGDLPGALALMLAADRLPTDISRAPAWHGRGLVLLEAGLLVEAVELLERATTAALEDGQELQAGETLIDLAQGQLVLDDAAAALATADRAARTLSRVDAPAVRRRAALVRLTARLRSGGPPGRVASRGAALAEQFDDDGDHVAADLARLLAAEALTRRARHTEAVQLLARSADLARVGSLSTRMRTRTVLATAARADGDLVEARRHVRAALADLAEALGGSASLELRAVTVQHAQDLARLDVELAGRRPAARLAAVERWNEVASRTPAVRPPAEPELAQRVARLRHLGQELRDDPGRAGELRDRIRALERQVAAASWAAGAGRGARGRPVRVPLDRVREELADRDATAVCFVEQGGARLGAAVLTARRTRWVDLGPAQEVAELVHRLTADLGARARVATGPMVDVVQSSLASSARALDDRVLRPLGVEGRLVVVPVPALAAVAWGMLPSRTGRPTTVTPSLGSWVRGARQVTRPRATGLAGPGLPGAPEETGLVSSVWGVPAPDGLARSADLAASLTAHDLVHVAAHGSHRSDSPLFSSLWLEDGPMFLADLERVERTATHVVVSACEAGRAHARGGAATLGLASGLLSLGVSSVVASPCRVPDATAAAVMPRYHRALADGLEVDEALAAASVASDLPLTGAFVAWGSPWSVTARG
ncbi:CHAT domain-containing protein [Ornithinimicrobium pekingense]|uniref:CHAT domain-containing protein n=1 Tax=Ornithinimicrobium pekingense TaxID=384677 RepID=A0ABQ2F795_9MICO|nr:CHAT domain-containing protein [Ornithinimicrobium pekingense]GGK66626.1 CHAT domain-containing protein [Ornithinimicrobium pekingense]